MDETLSRVALDISGRPFTVWKAEFSQKRLGAFDTELFEHWFQSFAQAAGITLHVETLHGRTNHHIIESIFKATARALRTVVEITPPAEFESTACRRRVWPYVKSSGVAR